MKVRATSFNAQPRRLRTKYEIGEPAGKNFTRLGESRANDRAVGLQEMPSALNVDQICSYLLRHATAA